MIYYNLWIDTTIEKEITKIENPAKWANLLEISVGFYGFSIIEKLKNTSKISKIKKIKQNKLVFRNLKMCLEAFMDFLTSIIENDWNKGKYTPKFVWNEVKAFFDMHF